MAQTEQSWPTRRRVLEGLADELAAAGVENARLEAERLLGSVLRLRRHELALGLSEPLRPDEARPLARAVRRRLSGEPLQHIEGTVEFRHLRLTADDRALIPRPETEQLVDHVLAWARSRRAPSGPRGVRVVRRAAAPGRRPALLATALDIGTGSGAIALALVQEGVVERAVGIDSSGSALRQAAENRASAGLEGEVELRHTRGSIWDALGPDESFDVVVSNPPYVPESRLEDLPVEVRDHDPREALAGGADGLDVIRKIAAGAPDRVRDRGALFLEIGAEQGSEVRRLLESSDAWRKVEIRPDLAGRERFAIAWR